MLEDSIILLKYRTIYLDKIKKNKISKSSLNKSNNLKKLDKVNLHNIKDNSKILNRQLIPLTMNLNSFGELINNNNPIYILLKLEKNKPLYKFNNNIFIYLKNQIINELEIINEYIIFKNNYFYIFLFII